MPDKNRIFKTTRWWGAQRVRESQYAFALFETWAEAVEWVLGDQSFAPRGTSYDERIGAL